jgi:hypothetical protein
MKYNVELDIEVVDKIVVDNLHEIYHNVLSDNGGLTMFTPDRKRDTRLKKKLLKALKRVHNYYAAPGDRIV